MIINNYWTIATVIMIVAGVLTYRKNKNKRNDTYAEVISNLFLTLLFSLFLCFVLYCFGNTEKKVEYRDSSQLVALNDYTGQKSESSGGMFLFIGGYSNSSSDTYNIRYASRNSKGVIKIEDMEMNNKVGFVDDNGCELVTIWHQTEYTLNSLGSFLFDNPMDDCNKAITDYEFHISKGSITSEINIDLK